MSKVCSLCLHLYSCPANRFISIIFLGSIRIYIYMLIYEICFSLSYFTLYAVLCLVTVLSICDPMDYSLSDFFAHGDSPGKNTGVGCHAFLQRIFPTQGLNTLPPHCRWNTWVLNHLNHQGSPWILEWVTYPFSRGSFWPRDQTGISGIAGRVFISWATREALILYNRP